MGGKPRRNIQWPVGTRPDEWSRFLCYWCKNEWSGPASKETKGFYGMSHFDLQTKCCPKCESAMIRELMPNGTVLKPFIPKKPSCCSSCVELDDGTLVLEEMGDKFYWVCAECRNGELRGGTWNFDESTSASSAASRRAVKPPD